MAPGRGQTNPYRTRGNTLTLNNWLPVGKLRGTPTSIATSYASGTLWPHGEWSLGYAKERPNGGDWHEDPYVGMGVDDTDAVRERARAALPLNLSGVPNSQARPRRGLKGITGYGAQMIKAAGHLLQEKYPHHRKTLGTVTLPPMSPQARREVVEQWPELTRQFLQWLSGRLRRQSLPQAVLTVSEIQPKRLQAHGEGYLHWHSLWLNLPGKAGNWAIDPCDVRAFVSSLLARKCPSYQGGHVNVNTKAVDGVVAAYLAKYMSKGRQQIAEAMEDWGEGNCPRTWWNMTKPARDMVKAATHRGRAAGALLETILHWWLDNPSEDCYAFLKPIVMDFDGWESIIGWRGRMEPHLTSEARGLLDSAA